MEKGNNKSLMIETMSVIGLITVFSLVFRQIAPLLSIAAIVYLLVERKRRGRAWSEIGFNARNTIGDLGDNWYWIVIVGVIIQFIVVLIAKYFIPGFFEHVKSRIPGVGISQIIPALLLIIVSTFIEEVIYRGFFQERVSWYIKPSYSIILLSIVFSMMHYSKGTFGIVAYDIGTVFVDSIFYGIIYNRTKNIFSSWIGHLLADIVGLILLLSY